MGLGAIITLAAVSLFVLTTTQATTHEERRRMGVKFRDDEEVGDENVE
tara:strand:+ start:148 stop:291 length:144 start_codon:yes stop_codon:yes gene_type:complete